MVPHRYILFDGDVDALWVENMNSVMDDNKLLTLANGERIRLQSYSALLFEVMIYRSILNSNQVITLSMINTLCWCKISSQTLTIIIFLL